MRRSPTLLTITLLVTLVIPATLLSAGSVKPQVASDDLRCQAPSGQDRSGDCEAGQGDSGFALKVESSRQPRLSGNSESIQPLLRFRKGDERENREFCSIEVRPCRKRDL